MPTTAVLPTEVPESSLFPRRPLDRGPRLTAVSPNGGSIEGRQELNERFSDRVSINWAFSRRVVSYQGNKRIPGFRWFKYKEAFSRELVLKLLSEYNPKSVLDPFAGSGTTPIVAAGIGAQATGIEIMPVGTLVASSISAVAGQVPMSEIQLAFERLIDHVAQDRRAPGSHYFPHVPITAGAFEEPIEHELAKAREYIAGIADTHLQSLLTFTCMSVLESVSYTRKDGQYLRWDHRSGRTRAKKKLDKGPIPSLKEMLDRRCADVLEDMNRLKTLYGHGSPTVVNGSSLELLKDFREGEFDFVLTSPPYANRYDYTRTYAIELAWLGYDRRAFGSLRQRLLSATVENKTKIEWLNDLYAADHGTLAKAKVVYDSQSALGEIVGILESHASELSNKNVIRLIKGYFLEMAVIIAELGRVVRPGGTVIMVNDNVQYHGEEVPVDLILSDFAEQCGFSCTNIWMLPRGKGNASQQMARFGRREMRKCVYKWVRVHE